MILELVEKFVYMDLMDIGHSIINNRKTLCSIENKDILLNDNRIKLVHNNNQQQSIIKVNGHGEVSMTPDKVKLMIIINSYKDDIQAAKNSVNRRFEYIFQTLRKHKISVRIFHFIYVVLKIYNRFQTHYKKTYKLKIQIILKINIKIKKL